MQTNTLAVFCAILATVQAYGGEDTGQFQQAFPQQPEAYKGAEQRYKRFKHPHNPLLIQEGPEDLFKLEARLNRDTRRGVQGEVEEFTRLQEIPTIDPNYDYIPLCQKNEQCRERLSKLLQIPSQLLRSPVLVPKGLTMPRVTWPAFRIPTEKLVPKHIMNQLLAAILQEVMINQIKQGLLEPDKKPQDLASMGKRATTQVGIITTKLIVHQMVRAVMFAYTGPLGILVAEEALYALGEYIAKKVMKKMKKPEGEESDAKNVE